MTIQYTWQDASAPTVYAGSGVLINLLKACLVNGYGSKPGAGWTIAYEDIANNKIVLKQPSGTNGRYLWIDDNLSSVHFRNAAIKLFETMSDIDTGTGETPTAAQEPNTLGIRKSVTTDSTERPWRLFVTDNGGFFILQIGVQCDKTLSYMNSSTRLTFIGDLLNHDPLDDWSTCICADDSNDIYSSGYGSCFPMEFNGLGFKEDNSYLMRGRDQLTSSVPFSQTRNEVTGNGYGLGVLAYPSPDGLWHFIDVPYHDENTSDKRIRGKMPLLKAPMHKVQDATLDGVTFSLVDGSKSFMLLQGGNFLVTRILIVEI